MSEPLFVPNETYDTLYEYECGHMHPKTAVLAITRPVVAAELRRLADDPHFVSYGTISSEALFDRADELEGEA